MDITSPALVKIRTKRLNVINEAMASSDEIRIKYQSKKNIVSNYWKFFIGQQKQLKRMKVIDQKRDQENKFNEWVNADKKRKLEYGFVLNALQNSYMESRKYAKVRVYMREALQGTEILRYAYSFSALEKALNEENPNQEDIKAKTAALKSQVDDFFSEYDAGVDKKVFAVLMKTFMDDIAPEQRLHPNWQKCLVKVKAIMRNGQTMYFQKAYLPIKTKCWNF